MSKWGSFAGGTSTNVVFIDRTQGRKRILLLEEQEKGYIVNPNDTIPKRLVGNGEVYEFASMKLAKDTNIKKWSRDQKSGEWEDWPTYPRINVVATENGWQRIDNGQIWKRKGYTFGWQENE